MERARHVRLPPRTGKRATEVKAIVEGKIVLALRDPVTEFFGVLWRIYAIIYHR